MPDFESSPTGEILNSLGAPLITTAEFELLRDLVRERIGITLGPEKKSLLQGRLQKRLRELSLPDFHAYHEYLLSCGDQHQELQQFANAVTTNKTDFFRESHHFEFIAKTWLPPIVAAAKQGRPKSLRIWSAACSSGEEPYTLAFTLLDALGADARSWDVSILATDINTRVLETAANGIYPMERVSTVPRPVLERHFLRGTGKSEGFCRVRANVRALVTFRKLNFMDAAWPMRKPFDLVFCRNALIYFDRKTQENLVRRFMQNLVPEGYLILGHSECVHGWFTDLKNLGNTVYRKTT